jgi:hypothetical protein
LAIGLLLSTLSLRAEERRPDGPFLNLLWLIHADGAPEAADPAHDANTKAKIAAALAKGKKLTLQTADGLITPETFARLAGDDQQLDPLEVQQFLEKQVPPTRKALHPALESHARLLTTGFDQIGESRRESMRDLVNWIVENYKIGEELPLVFICTGNSRRSMLGSSLGNLAAAHYGLNAIRCYSGGTKPTAFNPRTIATLQEIGFAIDPAGKRAAPGSDPSNPIYNICWGDPVRGSPHEFFEFSKRFDDPQNPSKGFAAIMVCSEADAACPSVPGAGIRISMPYQDPNLYDDTDVEARKYAERRDDIGRTLMAVMMQARLKLVGKERL